MGEVVTVLREHREQKEEIARLTDLFHLINGRLIVLRETETTATKGDLEHFESLCQEALKYP